MIGILRKFLQSPQQWQNGWHRWRYCRPWPTWRGCRITRLPRNSRGAASQARDLPRANNGWSAGSCSSVGCHNGNGLQTDRGSEYTTWILHDQHAHAYEVLFNARSASIVKNLNREDGKMAHELGLCLNCHVHEAYDKSNHNLRFTKEDGVSCESCHGAASSWISDHYKANVSYQEKVAMGMRDTRSMAGRVRSCTPCHVGRKGWRSITI